MVAVIIEGRLTRDVEVKALSKEGKDFKVATLTVASSLKIGANDRTTFIDVEVWNGVAEKCGKYLKKGSHILVRGDLTTRDYEKDGQKRVVYFVTNADVTFLDSKPKDEQTA